MTHSASAVTSIDQQVALKIRDEIERRVLGPFAELQVPSTGAAPA
jgi:hypothetical protein